MHKTHSPLAILVLALTAWALFFLLGCSQYRVRGGLSYQGQYGNYSVSSDGKNIVYDVELKNPNGWAK